MFCRAEEEAAARAKAEKQCRDLSTQVSELQDDLDSEKDAKSKVEKMRKQLNDVSRDCGFELWVLKNTLYIIFCCMFVHSPTKLTSNMRTNNLVELFWYVYVGHAED